MTALHSLLLVLAGLLISGCGSSTTAVSPTPEEPMRQEPLPLIVYDDFDDLDPWLHRNNDTTYIINFWATWCKPCVAELPYFQQAHRQYHSHPVRMILVSLDMPNQLDKRLKPYIAKQQLLPQVIALTDTRSNSWINRVHPQWSGAIPATLIYRNDQRTFFEKQYHSLKELTSDIETFL